jgi:ribosomal-protein-alanine N-acetyltransferase
MPTEPKANSQPPGKPRTSIRRAKGDDLAAILATEQASSRAAHWSPDHYQNRIQSPSHSACFLVAESEEKGKVYGFVCARVAAGEWEIENVVVDEKFRRQGIAAQLMQSLIKHWQDAEGTALLLEVRASNTPARTLYERHGFREVGGRRSYYRDPSEDAILYARYQVSDFA